MFRLPAAAELRRRVLRPLSIGGVVLSLVALALLVNLIGLYGALNERERSLIAAAQEDMVWSAYQIDREASKLVEALHVPDLEDRADWLAGVSQRYDILYSRTGSLSEGQIAAKFGETARLRDMSAELAGDIVALAPMFDAINATGDITENDLAILEGAVVDIEQHAADFIIAVNARHNDIKVAERAEVNAIYNKIAWSAGGLTLVFGAFIVLLVLQLRHIGRLRDNFQRAAAAADTANRAKSSFLAAMSHEIRTPLNGILGMAELIADGPLNSRQSSQLGVIRHSGDILLDIINDILDFSKLESGAIDLATTTFPLDEVIEPVRSMMAPRAAAKGIGFSVDCPDVTVTGDPGRLKQVLINLIGNAVKFTSDGRVTVTGMVQTAVDGQTRLRFDIVDTGIGMSEATTSNLFREFVQGDPSISRRFGGTGLGLAICRRLVQAMGGTVTVSSAMGLGSTFSFQIPCQVGPAMASPAGETPSRPLPAANILVVEDNAINRQVARGLLEKLGMRVQMVENGAEAIDALASDTIDLVLMDMQMPVMDGLTATRQIRTLGYTLPVIGVSANAFSSDRDACLEAGMDEFLSKPLGRARLEPVLQRFLKPAADAPDALSASSPPPLAIDKEQQQALIAELGQETFDELMTHFHVDAAELLAEARSATDNDTRVRAMHTIKGMARTLGLASIAEESAECERSARDGEALDCSRLEALLLALATPVAVAA